MSSDDLTTAYMLGVEHMRDKLHKQADEIERLRSAMHDIYEVFAGIDGYRFKESHAYRKRIVSEMAYISAIYKRAPKAIRESGND